MQNVRIVVIKHRKLNPAGFHLLKYMQNPEVRNIILYGGSSSGKTFSVAQCFLIFTFWEGTNQLVMRKVGASIKDTVYASFKSAADQLGMKSFFRFQDGIRTITCLQNSAKIVFKGLDDSEKIKGLEDFKRVFLDEWNEFTEDDHRQIRLRLRGMEGQQYLSAFNPIKETHWIKVKVFDTQKWHDVPMDVTLGGRPVPPELTEVKSLRMNEPRKMIHSRTREIVEHAPDTVIIQATYLNNFWVVGSPDGKYGYYDEQCIATFEYDKEHDPDYYNVYALGEWGVIRTGSEFFGSFNRALHVSDTEYDPELPVHISVDSNVLPYISVTYWQIDTADGYHIRQIGETCAGNPDNTVRKSAKLVAARLRGMGVSEVVLHGDASTRAANNIDDAKRSFHDLFIETLNKEGIEVFDCVSTRNPSVALSGEFINAIFDNVLPNLSILIGEQCKTSVEDYQSVQKDVNGGILKTRVKNKTTMQTYEEHGHISDTMRYLVTDVLREQFLQFVNRRKRNIFARDGAIRYFNSAARNEYTRDLVYCMPNVNGKCVMVHGKMCGDAWHIVNVALRETDSTQEITDILVAENGEQTIIECGEAYYRFARDLRKYLRGVRVTDEEGDLDRRIAATSDFVKNYVRFRDVVNGGDEISEEYSRFIDNLFDYNKNSENKEANAVLSGFVQFAVKFGFKGQGDVKSTITEN